jgi:hypothetical protein
MSGNPPAKIPSLGRRIAFASLRLIGLLIVFVAVPLGVLNFLAQHGINPPLSLVAISSVGIVLSLLGAASTVARPTRAYGPLALAAAIALLFYLLTLARNGILTVGTSDGGTFQLSYGNVFLIVAGMAVLSCIAAALTIYEDATRPGQRLPYDYPP